MTPPSATASCWRRYANTSWNHGYKGITENGRAGSHLVSVILQWPPKKKSPKGGRGQEFRVHAYPTVSSRPRGRRVQSLVEIGSEMWICISFIHTNKHSSLYIRYVGSVFSWPVCVLCHNDLYMEGYSSGTLELTLILLTWRIGWAPNNASKWQMGFNLAGI